MARIFITGSTDGLGRAAAEQLVASGHDVVLHARSAGRADAVADLATDVVIGDLTNAADVRAVADQVNAIGRMDAIIHNAGIYTTPDRAPTADGHAKTFAVNTLGPYILTALIERPDRLVYLSSSLHRGGEGSIDDLDWTRRDWNGEVAYAESKLHLIALAFALARRWPDVRANAVDPGWVRTRMGGASAPVDIPTGGRTQAWLAAGTDPATRVSGFYWHDQKRDDPSAEAADSAFQDRLVSRLADITGIALP